MKLLLLAFIITLNVSMEVSEETDTRTLKVDDTDYSKIKRNDLMKGNQLIFIIFRERQLDYIIKDASLLLHCISSFLDIYIWKQSNDLIGEVHIY